MRLPREEIARKLLHLFALTMPAGIYTIPMMTGSRIVAPGILAVVLTVSILVERLRQKNPEVQNLFYRAFGSMLRQEERHRTTGSTWVIGAALVCSIVFRNELWIACVVLTIFILGDAVAALVGMSIGKIKIGKKSLEGSLACFSLCIILLYAIFPLIPGLIDFPGGRLPLTAGLVTSAAVTILELLPLRISSKVVINDNLAVPVITGVVLHFMTAG